MYHETIAAISTPAGIGAVGMVRLSGADAIAVAARVFRPHDTKIKLESMRGYRGVLGKVCDDNGPVDEVVAFVYRGPRSYTGEDVVELCCHGGSYAVRQVLRLCLDAGARPALAGEFTKRAFLNGKMDLTGAEAVMDLVSAQGRGAMRAAFAARDGALAGGIAALVEDLTGHCAHIAAWTDYPEEDLIPVDEAALARTLVDILGRMRVLLAGYDKGRLLREGINAAIAGRPNVGKSTLMNLLTGHERSIVTPEPGTTRDVVQEKVTLADLTLNLSDTAGIREALDAAEQEGVSRSLRALSGADLILAVFDGSQPLQENDRDLLPRLTGKNVIAVINKADLPQTIEENELKKSIPTIVEISAKTGKGREVLEKEILAVLELENIDPAGAIIANERQRQCLDSAAGNVEEAVAALNDGVTLDAVCVCLDCALDDLLALTGQRAGEAVVDEVFTRFCVGK